MTLDQIKGKKDFEFTLNIFFPFISVFHTLLRLEFWIFLDNSTTEKMMDLASFSYEKLHAEDPTRDLENLVLNIRIWLSSGKGDFSIYSNVIKKYKSFRSFFSWICWIIIQDKKPIFYACTFIPTTPYESLKEGVKEYTVTLGKAEHETISSAKSTSYLENSIIANAAKVRSFGNVHFNKIP